MLDEETKEMTALLEAWIDVFRTTCDPNTPHAVFYMAVLVTGPPDSPCRDAFNAYLRRGDELFKANQARKMN